MSGEIPFTDVYVDDAIVQAAEKVLRSTRYVKGPNLDAFEREIAEFVGVDHAVGVSNGTAALFLSMKAIGIGDGDDVVLPANSFFATASPVLELGGNPVFVNVDPNTYTMTGAEVNEALIEADHPAAILPVHLYGHPCEMDTISDVADDHGVPVIEDACQAHAATYRGDQTGSFGKVGCFSFYPSKNMTVGGDGGVVVTDDASLAREIRAYRNHGRNEEGEHVRLGLNHRLDEINAAIGREQLNHLPRWVQDRRTVADRYNRRLSDLPEVDVPREIGPVSHAYHLYVIRATNRNSLQSYLEERGVETSVHYPRPLHHQPAIRERVSVDRDLGPTERLCDRILSLPMHPRLTEEDIDTVCALIAEFYRGTR